MLRDAGDVGLRGVEARCATPAIYECGKCPARSVWVTAFRGSNGGSRTMRKCAQQARNTRIFASHRRDNRYRRVALERTGRKETRGPRWNAAAPAKVWPTERPGGKAEVGHPQTRKVVWWRAIFFAAAAIGASSQVGQALSNQICRERPPPTADAPDRERRGGGKPCRPKNKPNFLATLEATRGRPAASLHHRPQGADCVVTWSRCSVVSRTARQQTAYCSPARTKRTTLHQKELVTLRRKDTTKGEEAVSR